MNENHCHHLHIFYFVINSINKNINNDIFFAKFKNLYIKYYNITKSLIIIWKAFFKEIRKLSLIYPLSIFFLSVKN